MNDCDIDGGSDLFSMLGDSWGWDLRGRGH